ncbi:MAG: hypothetical protein ACRC14_18355 [Paracoccaceae bacterium]
MRPPPHVVRLSLWLYWTASVLVVVLPLTVLLALLNGWADPPALGARFPALPEMTVITQTKAAIVTLIGALTLPVLIVLCLQMRALFGRYARGEVLSAACAGHIRRIGQMLGVLAGLGVLVPTLQMLALTYDNPVGQKVLSIGLTGETLGYLLAAGMLMVVGWVMGAAAAEIEGFV